MRTENASCVRRYICMDAKEITLMISSTLLSYLHTLLQTITIKLLFEKK